MALAILSFLVGGALLIGFVGFSWCCCWPFFGCWGAGFGHYFPRRPNYSGQRRLEALAPQVCGQPRCGLPEPGGCAVLCTLRQRPGGLKQSAWGAVPQGSALRPSP